MAEYVDREKVKSKKVYSEERHELVVPVAEIDWLPTEDVVPRSEYSEVVDEYEQFIIDQINAKQEVAKSMIDEISRYISLNENIAKKCKEENGEQNREYFKGKLSAFLQVQGFIDIELKRQYKVVKNEA